MLRKIQRLRYSLRTLPSRVVRAFLAKAKCSNTSRPPNDRGAPVPATGLFVKVVQYALHPNRAIFAPLAALRKSIVVEPNDFAGVIKYWRPRRAAGRIAGVSKVSPASPAIDGNCANGTVLF